MNKYTHELICIHNQASSVVKKIDRDDCIQTETMYCVCLLFKRLDKQLSLLQKNNELANPDTLYGLPQRIVAVEAGNSILQQFQILQHYLNHLLPAGQRHILGEYLEYSEFMTDLAKPVYTCVTSRVIELSAILGQMSKVKWDVNHVTHQHSGYTDVLNRVSSSKKNYKL